MPNATCILCGSRKGFEQIADHLRDSQQHSVIRCINCGHVQIAPLPSPEDDKRFYDENRQAKNIGERTEIDHLRTVESYDTIRRTKFIVSRFPQAITVLDVGCGHGFFLAEMSCLGYRVKGIEISRERRTVAEKVTTAAILNVDLLESTPELEAFDVITMFHLLEHLSDPVKFCKILRRYLTEQGSLVIEVPNLDDLMLEACPPYRSFWWQRAHISYFNRNTLHRVLVEAGYSDIGILGVQRYGIDNRASWLVTGKPQIDSPSFETAGSYTWLERYYKSYLENILRCDTLMAVAHV